MSQRRDEGYLHFSQFEDPSQCPPCDCGGLWTSSMRECPECGAANPYHRDEIFDDTAWTRGTTLGRRASNRMSGRLQAFRADASDSSQPQQPYVVISAHEGDSQAQRERQKQEVALGEVVTPQVKVMNCLRALADYVEEHHDIDLREELTKLYHCYFTCNGAFFNKVHQTVYVDKIHLSDVLSLCLLACYGGKVPLGAPDLVRLVISRELPLMELLTMKEIRPLWVLKDLYHVKDEDALIGVQFVGRLGYTGAVEVCHSVSEPTVFQVHRARLRHLGLLRLQSVTFQAPLLPLCISWSSRVLRLDAPRWPLLRRLLAHLCESASRERLPCCELHAAAAVLVALRMAAHLGAPVEPQQQRLKEHLGMTFFLMQCEQIEYSDLPELPPLFLLPQDTQQEAILYYRFNPANPSANFDLAYGMMCKWIEHDRCAMLDDYLFQMERFLVAGGREAKLHAPVYTEYENYFQTYHPRPKSE